ncbi:hypothetical protein MKW98_006227 [Papaver atlanticum]|uniref:Uncharacterized protein n=1 Tax=Papaver atlanticum TaxID=357466 RepID=A0AAD4XXK9_9MAGN|nr:hypothetical protein MKW98_006227 [Papaver atlanticum]
MDIIHDVTRRGDVKSLRRILAANPSFPLADPKFTSFLRTPLHEAVMLGYVDFASEILSINPGFAMELDSQGFTPLHLASTKYDVKMVSILIDANIDACITPYKDGRTPLHLAATRDEVKVMGLLIQKRPEAMHKKLLTTNETILHLCVKHNKLRAMKKLVDYLVTNRANLANNPDVLSVNSSDSDGNTILHLAAQNKRIKMLKYLIGSDDIKVDLNIRNNKGQTALHMLDVNEMMDIGIDCICYDYHNTCDVPQQITASQNERLKERLNTLMIIDSITDPVMFTYYLKYVIGDHAMSQGFQSYRNNLPSHKSTTGNITADAEIITYRANFVRDLLTAAISTPGIVLEDWWMNITSNYNTTMGGGSGFTPYLIRYAGTAILAYTLPKAYRSYILLNTLSVVAGNPTTNTP